MPEGHTVHRLARAFADLFGGQALAVTSPQGRFAAGASLVSGRVLVASEAWGKQLFLGFAPAGSRSSGAGSRDPGPEMQPELWLRVHLGLYGAWTFATDGSADVVHAIGAPRKRVGESETPLPEEAEPRDGEAWDVPGPRGAVRARLLGAHAVADLTGPTACEVITPADKAAVEARLGPDPVRPDGGRASLAEARAAFVATVRRSRVVVGQQLMDQAVVAGVGNIYRAEALFRAGLDPMRPGRDVDPAVLGDVWDDLVLLMHDGVARGAIVTTRPEDRGPDAPGIRAAGGAAALGATTRRHERRAPVPPGAVAREESFYVYQRDGLPCRVCGTPVLVKDLAGRSLYWCGVCQA
ncbi:Fpg/Nei family DNA glycosylase [Xylanimonas protaetiae]|uniref:DNA-(apurinic or apyrimidinic site) lyase n=1 Tax=Xylanimonas protaetiae TaxID=2509457 RepID=A0A4P6F3L3_9MICO|nr:zinc finger domain-containing protein [Xylanimonas protaetiae]QAY70470.1 Fpg/Nei family DNA glycosylase [Xylanimonas protaetiae]